MSGENNRRSVQRRRFLKITGGAATAGMLAGCSGDGGDGGGDGGDGGSDGGDGGSDGGDGGSDGGDGGSDGGDGGSNFPNREIRWIIPYSPGGGFDTYSRAIANRMPQYLPNSVNILAENVTGAGGRRGANETFRAEPNGYTIGIWNMPGMIAAQVVRETEYDTTEVSWLGRIVQEPYAMFAPTEGPLQSAEDLANLNEELGRPVRAAGTGPGSTSSLVTILALNAMDIDFEFVFGFAGTQEMAAATLRGETDLFHTSIGSSTAKSFVEGEDGQSIVYYGDNDIRPSWLEGVPRAEDAGYPSIQGLLANHRMVGGPPGIPEERLSTLESAFLDTVQSDEFSEWAEGAGRPVGPILNGEETLETVQRLRDTMEENSDVLQQYLGSNN